MLRTLCAEKEARHAFEMSRTEDRRFQSATGSGPTEATKAARQGSLARVSCGKSKNGLKLDRLQIDDIEREGRGQQTHPTEATQTARLGCS